MLSTPRRKRGVEWKRAGARVTPISLARVLRDGASQAQAARTFDEAGQRARRVGRVLDRLLQLG